MLSQPHGRTGRLIYLYVFTTSDEAPPGALERLRESRRQRTRLKPALIGTRSVAGGLPDGGDDEFARRTAATVCERASVAFDPAADDARYEVEEIDGERYGVLEIDAQRYPRAATLAAGALFFVVGLALGVNALSVWLLTAGLAGYIAYLWLRGPARQGREGWLFAFGPALLMGWVAGFVVRGVLF